MAICGCVLGGILTQYSHTPHALATISHQRLIGDPDEPEWIKDRGWLTCWLICCLWRADWPSSIMYCSL